jgi:hypothetical protein
MVKLPEEFPKPLSAEIIVVPPLSVVPPEYVLTPDKVNVPVPVFVSDPVPSTTPDNVHDAPESTCIVLLAVNVTARLLVKVLAEISSVAPPIATALVALPSPLFAEITVVPALSVEPPLYVLTPLNVKVPLPLFVSVPVVVPIIPLTVVFPDPVNVTFCPAPLMPPLKVNVFALELIEVDPPRVITPA